MSKVSPAETTTTDWRRLSQRYMAWLSFLFLLVTGLLMVYGVILSPNRESIAVALQTAGAVLGALTGFFTLLVCTYLGVSLVGALNRNKEQ